MPQGTRVESHHRKGYNVNRLIHLVIELLLFAWVATHLAAADPISFDLPPVASATADPADPRVVHVEFPLSVHVGDRSAQVDQLSVVIRPRFAHAQLVDYSPRTLTESDIDGSIQIRRTEEDSRTIGLGLNAHYFASGTAAADMADKQIESVEFQRRAGVRAVVTSGTIERGHGVAFKLRRTGQQVLEGEKLFAVSLEVPASWRASLIDVAVAAEHLDQQFFTGAVDVKTVGRSTFCVAIHRGGDVGAAKLASRLSRQEMRLRTIAKREPRTKGIAAVFPVSLGSVFEKRGRRDGWVERIIAEQADVYLDEQIAELPVSQRVAVLDYAEARDEFLDLNRTEESTGPRTGRRR